MKITIKRNYSGLAPLYEKYPRQTNAQEAYIELTEKGNVYVDTDAEIGNAVPAEVYHGRSLRWGIPNDLTSNGIDALLAELEPLLQRVYDGHDIDYDGNNLVGVLNEDGKNAEEEIETIIEDFWNSSYEKAIIYDSPADYFDGCKCDEISEDSTDADCEKLAQAEEARAENDGIYIDGSLKAYFIGLRDNLKNKDD